MTKAQLKASVAKAFKNVPQAQLNGNLVITKMNEVIDECYGTGTVQTTGTATLVAGTVVVATALALTGSKIVISRNTPGGTIGDLSAPSASIINATSFVINSDSALDVSTVNWHIVL